MSSLRGRNKILVQTIIMEGGYFWHAPKKVSNMYVHDRKLLYSLKKRGME